MLFGSLTVSGGIVGSIPSTLIATMPVISAVFALIGGIMAFNLHKWGSLFLFIAMGFCVPSRDLWLYGGIYFFAGLLCFFLKSRQIDEMMYGYEDDDYDDAGYSDDFYYEQPEFEPLPEAPQPEQFNLPAHDDPLNDEVSASEVLQLNADVPILRRSTRRMSKSCPECGAIVPRDSMYCSTCGAKLSVMSDTGNFKLSGRDDDIDIEKLNDQLLTPRSNDNDDFQEQQPVDDGALNIDMNDGDEMASTQGYNRRVTVKQRLEDDQPPSRSTKRTSANEAASSYKEFSRYADKGKKRKRSAGRKVLSMMLLVAAVGGALYFLLGLRKLPPGDLPPIAKNDVIPEPMPLPVSNVTTEPEPQSVVAEPSGIAVAENVLPNFTPDREPRNGVITGSSVNVRSDHTTSSSRVTRLKVNTRVEVLGTYNVTSGQYAGIWYNIRTGGNEGWVYGKYVQPLGSGLPAGYSSALLKTFGNSRSQLIDALGNPTRSTSSSAEWSGLTATLKGEDITRIRLTNSNRELQNGLKTGMSQTALLQIMGYPSSQNGRTLNYNENGKTGLSIQLDKNNSITSITVNEI